MAAACLTIGAGGCGGSSDSARQRFRSQARQICRDINMQLATASGAQKLSLGREEVRRLGSLTPPPELREKFRTYLANEADYYRRAEQAIARHDLAAANALNPHQDDQLTRDLGLTDCG